MSTSTFLNWQWGIFLGLCLVLMLAVLGASCVAPQLPTDAAQFKELKASDIARMVDYETHVVCYYVSGHVYAGTAVALSCVKLDVMPEKP